MADFISEKTGYPVKQMPGITGPARWVRPLVWIAVPAAIVMGCFKETGWPLFIVAGVGGLWWLIGINVLTTCPQCKRRMDSREVDEGDHRKRLFYDCQACQVTWRSDVFNDETSD